MEEVTLLNEPTAAALAYGDAVLSGQEKNILVYDLGGGTFDISLLEVSHDEVGYVFCTRVVDGDTFLGGDDIDAAVGRWLAVEIEKKHGQPNRSDTPQGRCAARFPAGTRPILELPRVFRCHHSGTYRETVPCRSSPAALTAADSD